MHFKRFVNQNSSSNFLSKERFSYYKIIIYGQISNYLRVVKNKNLLKQRLDVDLKHFQVLHSNFLQLKL